MYDKVCNVIRAPSLGECPIEVTLSVCPSVLKNIYTGHKLFTVKSIAAHRDHFVWRLSVCACVCLSGSHTSPHIGGPCECDRVYTVAYFFVKLGRHVNHDERMHPIDYRGQRSKVKVTMDIYGNKLET